MTALSARLQTLPAEVLVFVLEGSSTGLVFRVSEQGVVVLGLQSLRGLRRRCLIVHLTMATPCSLVETLHMLGLRRGHLRGFETVLITRILSVIEIILVYLLPPLLLPPISLGGAVLLSDPRNELTGRCPVLPSGHLPVIPSRSLSLSTYRGLLHSE